MTIPRSNPISVGHPVDVYSGTLFNTFDDHMLEGRLALSWERRYSTALLGRAASKLHGAGWWSPLEMALKEDVDGYRMISADGESDIEFDDVGGVLDRDGVIRNLSAFHELRRTPEGDLVVINWDVMEGSVTRYCFRPGGPGEWWPLRSIEELDCGAIDLEYDDRGLLTHVRQRRERRALRLERNPQGLVSAVYLDLPGLDDEPQRVARFVYDDRGRLEVHYDASGHVNSYDYDDAGRLVRETQAGGADYRFRFDDHGRCIEATAQDNYDYKAFRYFERGAATEVTDSWGGVTRYEFDPSGRVTSSTSAMKLVEAFQYDELGRVVAHTDPDDGGLTTRYGYDEQGNQCTVDTGSRGVFNLTFNTNHQPLLMTDAAGGTWEKRYNAAGYVVSTTNPVGETTGQVYDERGDLVAIIDPKGNQKQIGYNEPGDLVRVTDWEGRPSHYEYDPAGQLLQWTDPLGRQIRAAWDAAGNLIQVVNPDGTQARYEYGPEGKVTRIIDEKGHIHSLKYLYSGYLKEVLSANGERTTYEWSTEPGYLNRVVNGLGQAYRFERDLDGRIVLEETFDGRTFRLEYTGTYLTREVNNRGESVSHVYDDTGALVERKHSDGTSVKFAYDPYLGELTRAVNANSKVEFAYDRIGRLIRETVTTAAGEFSVDSTYDAVSNRILRRTSSGHETAYDYTPNGWVRAMTSNGREQVTFQYNDVGEELTRALPRGGGIVHGYDVRGRVVLQSVTRTQFSSPLDKTKPTIRGYQSDRAYEYDAHSNLIRITDGRWGTINYEYDPGERLTAAVRSIGLSERFDYDNTGNIVAAGASLNGDARTIQIAPWTYGVPQRVTEAGGVRYKYDDLGRVVVREETTPDRGKRLTRFEWDATGQLGGVVTPDGERWRYEYDAIGRRLAKHLLAPETTPLGPDEKPAVLRSVLFFWDGDQVVEERHSGGRTRQWTFEPSSFEPFSVAENGTTLYCVNDPAGAPHTLVHADGRRAWTILLTSWGMVDRLECDPGVDCPLRFEGQWFDAETGLHYNRHRYYDPKVGRYLSPDPIGISADENIYGYGVNPVSWTDPWGLAKKARCPRKKKPVKKKMNKGSDAPPGGGTYSFTDKNGKTYTGMTNNFKARMGAHMRSGKLPKGTKVTFVPYDPGTWTTKGGVVKERTPAGARRVRRFMEQKRIGVDSNGNVKSNPGTIPAVTQEKWDQNGKGRDFTGGYFR